MDDSNTVQKITLAYVTQRGLSIITIAGHSKVQMGRKTVGQMPFLLSNLGVLGETDSRLPFGLCNLSICLAHLFAKYVAQMWV